MKATLLAIGIAALAGTAAAATSTQTLFDNQFLSAFDNPTGPSVTIIGGTAANGEITITASGTGDMSAQQFVTNAAGVILRPDPTFTGNHPGEIKIRSANGLPFGAVLIGNDRVGYVAAFDPAESGLGTTDAPTDLVRTTTLDEIFGPSFDGFADGESFSIVYNDGTLHDNSGGYDVTVQIATIPAPATLALAATGLGVATRRRRRH